MALNRDLKAVLIQVVYDQYNKSFKTEVRKSRTLKFNTYALIFDTLFGKVMGNKDKTRDGNAATSTDDNRDHS